jgi:type 1 glutamine amidotransferase
MKIIADLSKSISDLSNLPAKWAANHGLKLHETPIEDVFEVSIEGEDDTVNEWISKFFHDEEYYNEVLSLEMP